MITTEVGDGYQFVTQPDHAALSGRLAIHWGNEMFDEPAPHSAVCLAATHHDHGWQNYDLQPHLSDDGTLRDFTSVPDEEWVEFYARGIEAVAAVDTYAGVLTSMHATGLHRSGYGVRPSIPDQSSESSYESFIDEQERFQRESLAELQDGGYSQYTDRDDQELLSSLHEIGTVEKLDTSTADVPLWRNYLLLQTVDVLSLYLCGSSFLEQTEISPVQTGDGEPVSLTIDPLGPSTVKVEPSPFDSVPLTVSVAARTVPEMDLTDENEMLAAYYDVEDRPVEFTLY